MSKEDEKDVSWIEECKTIPSGELNFILTKAPKHTSFAMQFYFKNWETRCALQLEFICNESSLRPFKEGAD